GQLLDLKRILETGILDLSGRSSLYNGQDLTKVPSKCNNVGPKRCVQFVHIASEYRTNCFK
ncbi:hypothetical protein BG011_008056, partial [Mortierella polycephala]